MRRRCWPALSAYTISDSRPPNAAAYSNSAAVLLVASNANTRQVHARVGASGGPRGQEPRKLASGR
jgi:hypothetical protein